MTNIALTEVLDKAHENKSVDEILRLPISALQGVSERDAEALMKAFGVKTVQDLADNKYFKVAESLVTLAKFQRQ